MILGLILLFICVCLILYFQSKLEEEWIENEILSLKNEEKTRLEKETKELERDAKEVHDLSIFIKNNHDEIVKSCKNLDSVSRDNPFGYKKHRLTVNGDKIVNLEENI